MANRASNKYAIVGGGISGMGAASYLRALGHRVELIECSSQLGGRFGTDTLGCRPIMMGGKNIGRNYTAVRRFVAAHGSHPFEYHGISGSRVVDGKLIEAHEQPNILHTLQQLVRSTGSARDLAHLIYLTSQIKLDARNRLLGSPTFKRISEKNDGVPLNEHFELATVRNILRPMTTRTSAAEPDEMYLGTFNIPLAMAMDDYEQLVRGIQPVIQSFSVGMVTRLSCRVDDIVLRNGAVVGLRLTDLRGLRSHEAAYDGVVIATPSHAAAEIVCSTLPTLGNLLRSVSYFPSSVAVIEYEQEVFRPSLRSMSLDTGPCCNASAYGVNDLHIVRYTFSGREARPLPSKDQLGTWIADAETEVSAHLGGKRLTRKHTSTQSWSAALCGYGPFHGRFLKSIRQDLDRISGLQLAGDYIYGANLEACFRSGLRAGRRIVETVK